MSWASHSPSRNLITTPASLCILLSPVLWVGQKGQGPGKTLRGARQLWARTPPASRNPAPGSSPGEWAGSAPLRSRAPPLRQVPVSNCQLRGTRRPNRRGARTQTPTLRGEGTGMLPQRGVGTGTSTWRGMPLPPPIPALTKGSKGQQGGDEELHGWGPGTTPERRLCHLRSFCVPLSRAR